MAYEHIDIIITSTDRMKWKLEFSTADDSYLVCSE